MLLTSYGDLSVDTFRLADVIAKALRIIDECPPKSKKSLGGIALVGHGETFYVEVNGLDLASVGDGTGFVLRGGDDGSGVAGADPDLTSKGLMTP